MRYWWVNQNQTYRHEVPGGYLWSPKRKANGAANPFYEFMREVAPGDVVFSFADTRIPAIGIVRSYGYEAPKPLEFGNVGANWDLIGWRVDVAFQELLHKVRPADYMDRLTPYLPSRYSPLMASGRGMQSVYLTRIPADLATELADLIGTEARVILQGHRIISPDTPSLDAGSIQWEEFLMEQIRDDPSLTQTTRKAIVEARRGQGLFKKRVMAVEHKCRLTGVDRVEHLRASHCKPWRDADNLERLDGENGLLLTPDADHLFDRGFLSFDDNGDVLVSPVVHVPSLVKMGLDPSEHENVGGFTLEQKKYLAFHRDNVFLQARLRDS